MKTKLITIIITILILVVPIAVFPEDINIPKVGALYIGGVLLLILFFINYKFIHIDKSDTLIILFAILIFISTMLSSNLRTSFLGAKRRYEGMFTLYSYIIIYLCTKKIVKYKNNKTLLVVLSIVYIAICSLGIVQYYLKIPEIKLFNRGVAGTFGNTNFMGNFVSMGIPIFSMMYILKNKKTCFAISLSIFFCLIACGARSAWVAFFIFSVLLGTYLIQTKNKEYLKRTVILFICFSIIFVYLFTAKNSFVKNKVNAVKNDVTTVTTEGLKKNLGSGRIQIWQITVDLIKKYPIFGVGTDNLKMRNFIQFNR